MTTPELSRYDLRLRSLDRKPGEPVYECSRCGLVARCSVWLHTPEWGPNGGATRVLCTMHAVELIADEARNV